MKLQTIIASILFALPAIAHAQEEAKPPKSVAQLQELLKAAIDNNRALATHANQMSTELAAVRKEMDALRTDIRKTIAERDKLLDQMVQLTDRMHQLEGVVKGLKERNGQLAEQLTRAKQTGKDSGEQIRVDGIVTAVSGREFLEISIGSDDGVRVGTKLEVFRNATYVGRVEVVVTNPDRAVAKPIAEFMKATPKKGDRVATKPESDKSVPVETPAEEPSE